MVVLVQIIAEQTKIKMILLHLIRSQQYSQHLCPHEYD